MENVYIMNHPLIQHKISMLMDGTDRPRDVADPWFTGDFESTWQDVLEGCQGLLKELTAGRCGEDG